MDKVFSGLEFAKATTTASLGAMFSVGIPPTSMGVEEGCDVCMAGRTTPMAAIEAAPTWNMELKIQPAGALEKIWQLVLPGADVPSLKMALNEDDAVYIKSLATRSCFSLPAFSAPFYKACCDKGLCLNGQLD